MEVSDKHSKRRMVWIRFNYGIIAGVAAAVSLMSGVLRDESVSILLVVIANILMSKLHAIYSSSEQYKRNAKCKF